MDRQILLLMFVFRALKSSLEALKIRSTHVGPRFDCPKYFGTPEARGRRGRAEKDVQLYPPQKNVPNNKSKTETRILTIFLMSQCRGNLRREGEELFFLVGPQGPSGLIFKVLGTKFQNLMLC